MVLSCAAASLVILCLMTSSSEGPLPTFGWAAAFLFAVVEEDVRRMRIPNWLTLPALVGALAYGTWMAGWHGLLYGLGGAAAGFALLFLPFAARWLGAGDRSRGRAGLAELAVRATQARDRQKIAGSLRRVKV